MDGPDGFRFSAATGDVDRERVHRWLSEESYWAQGRGRDVQDAAIDGSRNYSLFDADGAQVAYARVVTDGATFAWLCDVFVDAGRRGLGLGKRLVAEVLDDLAPLGIGRILLATHSAHGLYEQYGFTALADPTIWMVRGRGGGVQPATSGQDSGHGNDAAVPGPHLGDDLVPGAEGPR